jgi:hypothetical protein
MFTFMSKKKHIQAVLILQDEIQHWKDLYQMADKDSRLWRQRFELSQLTPEVKADTEAAFTRGEQNAKVKISATLMDLAMKLRSGDDTL